MQEPPKAKAETQAPPTAEKIIADYIEATGGRAARAKLRNRVIKGQMFVPVAEGRAVKQKFSRYEAPPNKTYFLLGDIDSGTADDLAWQITPKKGPRILEGAEETSILRYATFNFELHWKKLYKSIKCDGTEEIGSKTAYKVVMTPPAGKPDVRYFDKETKLLVAEVVLQTTPSGEIRIDISYDDFKEVDGIIYPHRIEQRFPTHFQIFVVESIEHNVEMPKDRFDPPDIIKVLRSKKKATDAGTASRPGRP